MILWHLICYKTGFVQEKGAESGHLFVMYPGPLVPGM